MWAIALKYLEPVLCWVCIIAIGAWVIYAGLIKPVTNPTPTTTQTGGVSYNYQIKVGMLSCAKIPPPDQQVATAIKPITDKIASTVNAVK
jgi:hypothetical protein